MPLICANPPARPANIAYASIRELYLHYENIFLLEGRSPITTPCGHSIIFFDHHFFHMVGITVKGKDKLFMRDEKETILATAEGFAHYIVRHNGSRAKHLQASRETFSTPDEIWEDNPRANSRWVYIKEYDAAPYPFSVALVTDRPEQGIIVPVTSFPCKKGDVEKWRNGKRLYP